MEIRLLGPVDVSRDGAPVSGLSGRLRSLLAVLALAAPDPVPVETIGRRIWGDDPPDNLRPSVQSLVFRLRRLLGPDAAVDYISSSYALRIAPDRVDVLRFRQLIDTATNLDDPTAQRDRLSSALALWRGEPFGGVDSEWLEHFQAPALVETYLSAVERRTDLDLAAGRYDDALPELRALAAAHPLRESLWLRLLTVLNRCGRPAEALTLYEQLRARLADGLGADPDAQLRALHAELLRATQPQPAAPAQPGVVPRQLPPAPARFTGRAATLKELDRLSTASQSGTPTIIALHGPGGVGKTAVALYWAQRRADRFPGGQLYLNLQGYGPDRPLVPDTALDLLLRGLGVSGAQIPQGRQARTALFRSLLACREVLIVLDNARDAEQVRPLMPGAGGLVLVTSRSQLRSLAAREGAQRVPVEPFSLDDATAYLSHSLSGRQDTIALTELTRLCGQLPLALAIAAERLTREPAADVRALSVELARHPDRLALLDVGEDEDGALRAVFSWSYDVLDAQPARAFRLLGLHAGPDVSQEAVGALLAAPPSQAGHALGQLVGAHLLEQPGQRYQLHDLLAEYAARLVQEVEDDTERAAARTRLLDWYAHTALAGKVALEKSQPLLDFGEPAAGVEPLSFPSAREAVDWFGAERQALVAAMRSAVAHGHDRAAYRLGHALWPYFMYVRALDELFEIQCLALDAARRTGHDGAEAVTTHAVGRAYLFRHDLDRACKHLDEALRMFELLGDDRGRGSALTDLGRLHRRWGDIEAAVRHHRAAIEVLGRLDDTVEIARNHSNLADAYLLAERYPEAVEAARAALSLIRVTGERRAEAFDLNTLAVALAGCGDHDAATRIAGEALELSRDLDDRWSEVCALTNLGQALQARGDVATARTRWRQALDILEQTGMPGSERVNPGTLQRLLTD
ncbi:BTAD domain-containing putative transcriptional regulator [Kribbella sp. NPDC048915]|uniref:AfsR/SARP family transcriptional regulator n=1 Tax=Kribbella sp. NPDC048915 TaxID=3155148 RepID=UPI0033D43107